MNIVLTGKFDEDEYLFRTLELTETEFQNLEHEDLKQLEEKYKVDFITVERNAEIGFLHYADITCYDFIQENGLKTREGNIGDLGQGIYAIYNKSDHTKLGMHLEGEDNVCTWLEGHESEEIVEVEGVFKGTYTECVHGYQHKGYLLLKDGEFQIQSIREMDVGELIDFEF